MSIKNLLLAVVAASAFVGAIFVAAGPGSGDATYFSATPSKTRLVQR